MPRRSTGRRSFGRGRSTPVTGAGPGHSLARAPRAGDFQRRRRADNARRVVCRRAGDPWLAPSARRDRARRRRAPRHPSARRTCAFKRLQVIPMPAFRAMTRRLHGVGGRAHRAVGDGRVFGDGAISRSRCWRIRLTRAIPSAGSRASAQIGGVNGPRDLRDDTQRRAKRVANLAVTATVVCHRPRSGEGRRGRGHIGRPRRQGCRFP